MGCGTLLYSVWCSTCSYYFLPNTLQDPQSDGNEFKKSLRHPIIDILSKEKDQEQQKVTRDFPITVRTAIMFPIAGSGSLLLFFYFPSIISIVVSIICIISTTFGFYMALYPLFYPYFPVYHKSFTTLDFAFLIPEPSVVIKCVSKQIRS